MLDAGCGAGAHAAELVARGASVTRVDLSAGLIEIARERLGPDAALHVGDLSEPLPFGSGVAERYVSPTCVRSADWGCLGIAGHAPRPLRLFTRQPRRGHEQLQPPSSQTWRRATPPGLARKSLLAEVYRIWTKNRPVRGSLSHRNSVYLAQPQWRPRST